MSSLYIHIPFCKTRCNYCDFYKSTSHANTEIYIDALEREMEYRRDFLASEPVKTIYFGGGTPSIYPPAILQRIIDKARTLWDLSEVTELTVEVNPDDINDDYLEELSKTEINRVSFGVQSFIDRDLQLLGRRHTAEQAITAIKKTQEKGYTNISLDLIFGIPGMSLREWENNVLRALLLNVQHISAYHLTIGPDTRFWDMVNSGQLIQIDEEMSEQQYLLCHQLLTGGGFNHYEISNYAASEQQRSKHNCAYWCGDIYLGLGPSAHSYDGDRRSFVVNDTEEYLKSTGSDKIYGHEILSTGEKYNEFIMTALRTSCGVRRDLLTEKFGFQATLYFEYAAEKYLQEGLMILEGNEYKIPAEKMLISNSIISDLFYVED